MSDPLNIQDMNLFQNTELTQATLPRPRRIRRCGHCRCEGHDRRTCPQLIEERRIARQQQLQREEEMKKTVEFINSSEHTLAIYWSKEYSLDITETNFNYFRLISPWTSFKCNCFDKLRIIAFSVNPDMDNLTQEITVSSEIRDNLFVDVCIQDLEAIPRENQTPLHPINIVTPPGFTPVKKILDQWKETAFKSLYLLKELERMGAGSNENLAPMIDMIQDIKIPQHTQYDKEYAGVPSSLTNIT